MSKHHAKLDNHFTIAEDLLFGVHPLILDWRLANTIDPSNPMTGINDILSTLELLTTWQDGKGKRHPQNLGALELHRDKLRSRFSRRHEGNRNHPFTLMFEHSAFYEVNEHSFGYTPKEWVQQLLIGTSAERDNNWQVEATNRDEARKLKGKVTVYITSRGHYIAKSERELSELMGIGRKALRNSDIVVHANSALTKGEAILHQFYKRRIDCNFSADNKPYTRGPSMIELGLATPSQMTADIDRIIENNRYTVEFLDDERFTDEIDHTAINITTQHLAALIGDIDAELGRLADELDNTSDIDQQHKLGTLKEQNRRLLIDCTEMMMSMAQSDVRQAQLLQLYRRHFDNRRYVTKVLNRYNIQNLKSELRDDFMGKCTQIDINASFQSAIVGLCAKNGIDLPIMRHYVQNKAYVRQQLVEATGLTLDEVKQGITAITNGSNLLGKTAKENVHLKQLREHDWMQNFKAERNFASAKFEGIYGGDMQVVAQQFEQYAVDITRKHFNVELMVHDAVYITGEVTKDQLSDLNCAVSAELGFEMMFELA